jgi:shikimate kinase
MKLPFSISLIGFSGSGKTTLGRLLARRTRVAFIDTDELIEQKAGEPIESLLDRMHQQRFRKLEREVIAEVFSRNSEAKVVALGGGAFVSAMNQKIVRASSVVVYLRCSVKQLHRRLSGGHRRPMLEIMDIDNAPTRQARLGRIVSLMAERRSSYESADYRISVSNKTVEQSLSDLVMLVERICADRTR